ncbi:hypothetical protein ACOMHN_039263 [Nucella lapillus]
MAAALVVPVMLSLTLCKLPSDAGPCSNWAIRYYFDQRVGHCRLFWYGGCEGNKNMFESMAKCDSSCYVLSDDKEATTTMASSPLRRSRFYADFPDVCLLEPERGSCSDYSIRWHFIPNDNQCRRFWYGGCQGNRNRFETEEECTAKCLRTGPRLPTSTAKHRLCDKKGWFKCQGPFDQDSCDKKHMINPYASRGYRQLFGLWNLDHIIEKSREVIPTLLEAARTKPKNAKMNWEEVYRLLFTLENLKLVQVGCHKKAARSDKKCHVKDFLIT